MKQRSLSTLVSAARTMQGHLDRLEKRGLISRSRGSKDRRMVTAAITQEGLGLLARMDEPVQAMHRSQLGHLGRARLGALTELLRAARREPI